MPAFALERPPRLASAAASGAVRRSSTNRVAWTQSSVEQRAELMTQFRSFGSGLEPRYIFRAKPLDQ